MTHIKNTLAILGAIALVCGLGWLIERALNETRDLKIELVDNLGGKNDIPIDGRYRERLKIYLDNPNRKVIAVNVKASDE